MEVKFNFEEECNLLIQFNKHLGAYYVLVCCAVD